MFLASDAARPSSSLRKKQASCDRGSALADAVTHHKAKNGSVVVLDVATSRVLAMSSYPPYDSNTGEGIADGARNRPVTDAYEAGSVMKLFTVAAALDAGMINADSWFDTMGGRMHRPKTSATPQRQSAETTAE